MHRNKAKKIAVCGIDTAVGKTVVTGMMAAYFFNMGKRVTTQKPIQTGCAGRPEDILVHRQLMGVTWGDFDEAGLTCSYNLPFAGSPHLAAAMAGEKIEPEVISKATQKLAFSHDIVLVEGAGGLLVPWLKDLLQLDYFPSKTFL